MNTFGTTSFDSPHPGHRNAPEQALDAGPGPGPDIYGPVPVHPSGQGWSPDATHGVRRPRSTQSPYGQTPFGLRGLPAKLIADVQHTSTELARRTQEVMPTSQAFMTPERALTDLAAPAVPTSPPRALMPLSPQQALMPPSCFDSAKSQTNQSVYGLRPDSPLIREVQSDDAGVPTAQSTEQVENPRQAFACAVISDQLLIVATANEQLASTVIRLQASVSKLEIQVSECSLGRLLSLLGRLPKVNFLASWLRQQCGRAALRTPQLNCNCTVAGLCFHCGSVLCACTLTAPVWLGGALRDF